MKFSIIVPVYNSQYYLERCIISIQNQSYHNWELILVDDGSKDDSWNIICKYMKNDARIRGIHQENKGPGIARNTAIDVATGDYVVFVDSDDYIDLDYLSFLEPKAKQNDLVFIDVVQVNCKGKIINEEKMSVYKELSKEKILRFMMTGKIPWGGVRKCVKLSLLNDKKIRYSDLKIGEEALFSFKSLYFSEKIGFLFEKPVYMYEVHKGSQSTIKVDDPWGGTFIILRQYLIENGLYSKFADTMNAFNISSTIVSIDRIVQYYSGEDRKNRLKKCVKNFKYRFDYNYGIDKNSLVLKAEVFIPFLKFECIFPIVIASKIKRIIRENN